MALDAYVRGQRVWKVGGNRYLVSQSTTIGGNPKVGYTFSHPELDLVPVGRCSHCGRTDTERQPARGIDEAIARGYLKEAE